MGELTVITGDVAYPQGDDHKIIAHCCNNIPLWGSGVVVALQDRWPIAPMVDKEFQDRYFNREDRLGLVSFGIMEPDITIANMIGQDGVGWKYGVPPIRYPALEKCMEAVAKRAIEFGASIHCPKFGAGRAGGKWDVIMGMITRIWLTRKINVTIYEFDEGIALAKDIEVRQNPELF